MLMSFGASPGFGQNEGGFTIETAPVKSDVALSCQFQTECFDTELCAETAFAFDLTGRSGGLDTEMMVVGATLSSESGDIELLGVTQAGATSLSGGEFSARHLLTIAKNGQARYSVHYVDGPMMISYSGICS